MFVFFLKFPIFIQALSKNSVRSCDRVARWVFCPYKMISSAFKDQVNVTLGPWSLFRLLCEKTSKWSYPHLYRRDRFLSNLHWCCDVGKKKNDYIICPANPRRNDHMLVDGCLKLISLGDNLMSHCGRTGSLTLLAEFFFCLDGGRRKTARIPYSPCMEDLILPLRGRRDAWH